MKALIILLLGRLSLTSPDIPRNQLHERADGIEWGDCNDPRLVNTTLQCGNLMVPKDYSDPESEEELRIDVIKAPATKKPSKGAIFINWGGPGGSGIFDMRLFSPKILAATGQQHDIINVIPRGTNDTLPFQCYDSDASRALGSESIAANSSDVATGRLWAKSTLFAENCAAARNETGRSIGTAFTARDIIQVVDAIVPDKMLRFWGISYGTVLGSTLAALFPDKVDRMILDGVVNPIEYYENREVQLFDNADDIFRIFIEGCAANPKLCPFAKGRTADQIEDLLVDLLEALKANPIPIPTPDAPGGGSLWDYSVATDSIFNLLYWPEQWDTLALIVDAAIRGDAQGIVEGIGGIASSPPPPLPTFERQDKEALYGIKCGDILDSGKGNLTQMIPFFKERRQSSRFFGVSQILPARCAQWKLPAKERYDGDFKVKTKTGVMIINNSYDPITPLSSARNLTGLLEGSSLLHQDGAYGHTTQAQFSTCTAEAIQTYIYKGILPGPNAKCKIDILPFSEKTGWEEVM